MRIIQILHSIWKFSRPHTIIGTIISITALYIMANSGDSSAHLLLLLQALIVGICCNIYIVGTNQIHDIELDKINKPFLPLASGALRVKDAKAIIYISAAVCLILSASLSMLLLAVVSFSMGIGWAYSNPPLYLRKHHITAAISIAAVRGLMVNIGGFLVFSYLLKGSYSLSSDIKILCLFITAFSISIAWFKDLPDMKGDAQFKIKTLALLYSPKFTLIAGNGLVVSAYCLSIFYYGSLDGSKNITRNAILFYGHLLLFFAFIINSLSIKKAESSKLKFFYKRFWLFFFAEYLLYIFAFFEWR